MLGNPQISRSGLEQLFPESQPNQIFQWRTIFLIHFARRVEKIGFTKQSLPRGFENGRIFCIQENQMF